MANVHIGVVGDMDDVLLCESRDKVRRVRAFSDSVVVVSSVHVGEGEGRMMGCGDGAENRDISDRDHCGSRVRGLPTHNGV